MVFFFFPSHHVASRQNPGLSTLDTVARRPPSTILARVVADAEPFGKSSGWRLALLLPASPRTLAAPYHNEYSGSANYSHERHQRQYHAPAPHAHHYEQQQQLYPHQYQQEPRGLESLDDLSEPLLLVQQMAHPRAPPHLGGGAGHLYGAGGAGAKPRARTHEELELDFGVRSEDDDADEAQYQHGPHGPHGQHGQHGQQQHQQQHQQHHLPPPTPHTPHAHHLPHAAAHHHHHLPDQPPPSKMARTGPPMGPSAPPLALQPAPGPQAAQMPSPAPRPRGPKLKFTPEDDTLLVDLKENKALTWKQIAEFFPGRSSGTLQVRYCTKLKAKTTQWTDETVSHPEF